MDSSANTIGSVICPFIDGNFTPSLSDAHMDAINPSDGQPICSLPVGSVEDVDRAVSSARKAFDDGRWTRLAPSKRKEILWKFAELISSYATELDTYDAGEMGKPVSTPFAGAQAAARLMRFFAEASDKVSGDVFISDNTSFVTQRRVPRGVVAAVVPWNFPTYAALVKVAPALAAGNAVILKPSELSSRSAMLLSRLAIEAGLPPGILNTVPGRGDIVGRALGLHMGVDMMTFTGSTSVGKRMLEYSGQSNIKVVMAECGGKSPHIVFDDGIDLDAACDVIAGSILTNQGQICSVGSRVLVDRKIENQLLDRIATRFGRAVVGNALDPQTTFGPLASEKQRERVLRFIDTARSEGGEVAIGGDALSHGGGSFVAPTLIRNVAPRHQIAQEEVFGPVLSIIAFDSEDEALSIANGTRYGLAAYLWTADLSRGLRFAKQVRSGVFVNAAAPMGEGAGHAASGEPSAQSGIGTEHGLAGMESYMRRQRIWFNHA